MNKYHIAFVMGAAMVLQTPVAAHSFAEQMGKPDQRVAIGLTIPFGSAKTEETKPRIDLHIRNESPSLKNRDTNRDLRQWKPDARIGVTLSQKPTLMLNGQKLVQPEKKARMGTWGYVAIGTVAVLAVSGALLWDAMVDASD